MLVCKQVTYSGCVQGVGFRYTSRSLAQHYPITGYVRNLANGKVELVAQGEESQVKAFLQALADRMADAIHDIKMDDASVGNYDDFAIRH